MPTVTVSKLHPMRSVCRAPPPRAPRRAGPGQFLDPQHRFGVSSLRKR